MRGVGIEKGVVMNMERCSPWILYKRWRWMPYLPITQQVSST